MLQCNVSSKPEIKIWLRSCFKENIYSNEVSQLDELTWDNTMKLMIVIYTNVYLSISSLLLLHILIAVSRANVPKHLLFTTMPSISGPPTDELIKQIMNRVTLGLAYNFHNSIQLRPMFSSYINQQSIRSHCNKWRPNIAHWK